MFRLDTPLGHTQPLPSKLQVRQFVLAPVGGWRSLPLTPTGHTPGKFDPSLHLRGCDFGTSFCLNLKILLEGSNCGFSCDALIPV